MGLLTNDQSRNGLVKLLLAHDNKLCVLTYIAGLVWFLALAYQPLNAGTYFSENALLPGLVESELPPMHSTLSKLARELQEEMERDNRTTPRAWVKRKFQELGLETFGHNFSIIYPFRSLTSQIMSGENVYSILRARRAASTEALVLSVPLRPLLALERSKTQGGVVLAIALAQVFKRKPYWSKDIIFLFPDFDEMGTLAWLDAYHGTKSQYIIGKELEARSGPIQAAINLELPADSVTYYNLHLEGLNGQLPNLDLVNLVVRLCRRERSQVSLHHMMEKRRNVYTEPNGESFEEYRTALTSMMKMMWAQASGAPSGNHGMYHKYHIEALTLQGVVKKKKAAHSDIVTSARIIEGVFRSLNNLLERFHQSFFFYLLPATNRYISIGMYMPAFGLMIAASLIKGLSMWVLSAELREKQTKEQQEKERSKKEDKKSSADQEKQDENSSELLSDRKEAEREPTQAEREKAAEEVLAKMREQLKEDDDDEDVDENGPNNPANQGFFSIVPVLLVSFLLAWMAHQGPELLTRIMPKFRIHTEDMIIYSLLAIFAAAIMFPKLMTSNFHPVPDCFCCRKTDHPNSLIIDWRLLKSLALIGQTLALACVALLNISQAVFIAAFMVPVTVFVKPCDNRFLRWFQMTLLALVSPLSLMFAAGLISVYPQRTVFDLLEKGYSTSKHIVFLGLMDSYLLNAWSETIFTAVIFPLWLMSWSLPWAAPTIV